MLFPHVDRIANKGYRCVNKHLTAKHALQNRTCDPSKAEQDWDDTFAHISTATFSFVFSNVGLYGSGLFN